MLVGVKPAAVEGASPFMDEEGGLRHSMRLICRARVDRKVPKSQSKYGVTTGRKFVYGWVRLFRGSKKKLAVEFNRAPSFLEVFDRTHKKKGTDQFVSESSVSSEL